MEGEEEISVFPLFIWKKMGQSIGRPACARAPNRSTSRNRNRAQIKTVSITVRANSKIDPVANLNKRGAMPVRLDLTCCWTKQQRMCKSNQLCALQLQLPIVSWPNFGMNDPTTEGKLLPPFWEVGQTPYKWGQPTTSRTGIWPNSMSTQKNQIGSSFYSDS